MIPKLMWLHFSPVSPFVLLVFTPGRAFPLAGCAPPLFQTPLPCGLAGRTSLAATAGADLALTRSPPPLEGLPPPLFFSPLLCPVWGNLSKFQAVNVSKSLAALPQMTPKASHSEGANGGGQEFGLRIWLVV